MRAVVARHAQRELDGHALPGAGAAGGKSSRSASRSARSSALSAPGAVSSVVGPPAMARRAPGRRSACRARPRLRVVRPRVPRGPAGSGRRRAPSTARRATRDRPRWRRAARVTSPSPRTVAREARVVKFTLATAAACLIPGDVALGLGLRLRRLVLRHVHAERRERPLVEARRHLPDLRRRRVDVASVLDLPAAVLEREHPLAKSSMPSMPFCLRLGLRDARVLLHLARERGRRRARSCRRSPRPACPRRGAAS